jgi:flagellar motor switch protein FliG
MSTSPENHLVNVLSHWLARHVDNAELLRELDAVDTSALSRAQAEAVQELREEVVSTNGRGDLEMVVRETLEAVALG